MNTGRICGPSGCAALDRAERAEAEYYHQLGAAVDAIGDIVTPDRVNEIIGDLLSEALHDADATEIACTDEARAEVCRRIADILAPGHADLRNSLRCAVARVELANAEGDPILSAWLPGARAAIAKATEGCGR